MTAYSLQVTCPRCGSDVELITSSQGWRQQHKAVVKCLNTGKGKAACRYQFIISVDIIHAQVSEEGEAMRCGEDSGYAAHRRRGEQPCVACIVAHNDKAVAYKRRRRGEIGMEVVA